MSNQYSNVDDEDSESLSDYLGHLLSSVAKARVQSDLETIQIAEQYQNHPLLKHFPVPRVRLPKVELTVPVIMVGTLKSDDEEKKDQKSEDTDLTSCQMLANEIVDSYCNLLDEAALGKFSNQAKKNICDSILEVVEKIYAEPGRKSEKSTKATDSNDVGKESLSSTPYLKNTASVLNSNSKSTANYIVTKFYCIKTVIQHLNRIKISKEMQKKLRESFLDEVRNLILNAQHKRASRLVIQARTSKVRESAHEHLATFKLTVTEDSVEWSEANADSDNSMGILVPE